MDAKQRITTFSRSGLTFDVTDAGPLDGEPVVLLHGFPTDRTSWHRIEPLLHTAGLRTLAPDQRGYSPGARPGGRAAYRAAELTADIVALIDATGHERVHLVGHDWGGAVSWALAANRPDRVASLTVLSMPHPAAFVRALLTLDQLRRSWYIAWFQIPVLPERGLAARFRTFFGGNGLPKEDLDRYAARFGAPDALTGPLAWYRAIPLSRLTTPKVRVPTTYIWGTRDIALGRHAAELTAEHVDGPYEFIELDEGHWLPETRPDECAAAIIARTGAGNSGEPG